MIPEAAVETCRGCEGPRTVHPGDDIPLCNFHWNSWLSRYLGADDQPCAAHLIPAAAPEVIAGLAGHARDELAELLANEIDDDVYGCTRVWEAWSYGTMSQDDFVSINDEPTVMAEIADAILAAGYRKPRTITTAEELEDLAAGSKLYSTRTTHSWELRDLSAHGGVKVVGTGGGYTHITDFIEHEAPLIVLHEPEAAS